MLEHKVVFVQILNKILKVCYKQELHILILITWKQLEHVPEPLGSRAGQGEGDSGRGKEDPAAATNGVQTSPKIQFKDSTSF